MNVKCPECGKLYRIDSQRIPAAGATVQCKQCDYAIKVLPETVVSEPTRVVVCPECAKRYCIAESRIPPALKAIECRACRGTIPLVKTPDPEDVVNPSDDVPEDEKAVPQAGLFQQRWFWVAGAVAAILLLCVCLWVGLYLPKQEGTLPGGSDSVVSQESPTHETSEQVPATDQVIHVSTEDVSPGGIINGLGNPSQDDESEALDSTETPEEDSIGVAVALNDRVESLLFAAGLTPDLDASLWRETLAHRFSQALAPSSSDAFGVKEAKYLDVELWGDNATLASVFYKVTQVMSSEGQPLAGCVGTREPMVGQRIRVPVQKGAKASEAVIQFEVSVPCQLDAAVLDVSAGVAVDHDMVTGSVTLAKVADQAVRLTYNKMSMPVVYAFDRLGNRLRREHISREKDGVSLIFGGQVETCLVVSVLDRVAQTFETCVTLDPGEANTLSYEPEVPKYTRFDLTPLVNYATLSSLDVNDLAVHWQQERQQGHFKQVLSVDLPENVAVRSNWEVYAHRWDRKVRLAGTSVADNQGAMYECRYAGPRAADQLSGFVQLDLFAEIERVTLTLEELSRMCCVEMPSGKYLDVSLDRNRLSYMVLGGDLVQVAAYDAQGRRLKQDPAWRFRQGMKEVYFWGVPAKVVLDISTQTKMARLDFSVTDPSPKEREPLYTTSYPSLRP